MVGMQPADVAGIEKGEYRISLDVLFRLLEVFQATISDFIETALAGRPRARYRSPYGTAEVPWVSVSRFGSPHLRPARREGRHRDRT